MPLRSLAIACGAMLSLGSSGCLEDPQEVTLETDATPSTSSTSGLLDDSSSGVASSDTSTSSGSSESGSESSSTSAGSSCGNGIVEAGEWCDDEGESPTCDANCSDAVCGDGDVNVAAGEICDQAELAGASCESLGYDVGELACGGGCSYDTSACYVLPNAPELQLGFSQIKRFDFGWAPATGADYYQLLERATPVDPFVQIGGDIVGESISLEMPLHLRLEASYVLRACNGGGCTDSATVDVMGSLSEAIGYLKASNTGTTDFFGSIVALSGDGNTLAVGALQEDSNGTGVGGTQGNNSSVDSGAVYVFARGAVGTWSQQAYVKASNTGAGDLFGTSVALSSDGNTLAVGGPGEDSNALGIGGSEGNNSAAGAGAVYVFVRSGMGVWAQQAYVKASNTAAGDGFGASVALSGDGNTLAVGGPGEDSNATGIGGNQLDNGALASGAVYVFVRDGMGVWAQQAYVKASNTEAGDELGWSMKLSEDGSTLVVDAPYEDSSATGVDGDQADAAAPDSGAVYVFVRDGIGAWSQQAYIKASNTGLGDYFGFLLALSTDGNTLAAGSNTESSSATGIDGDEADDTATSSGAVYVLVRDGMGAWSQQAYVKASNTGLLDHFGTSVALSGDGSILAVGATGEASSAIGIGGDEADDTAMGSGAAYVLVRDGVGTWSQQAYVKAPNTGLGDQLGIGVALSADGNTLAVGAYQEDGGATGISGDQADDSVVDAGAVYLY